MIVLLCVDENNVKNTLVQSLNSLDHFILIDIIREPHQIVF